MSPRVARSTMKFIYNGMPSIVLQRVCSSLQLWAIDFEAFGVVSRMSWYARVMQ